MWERGWRHVCSICSMEHTSWSCRKLPVVWRWLCASFCYTVCRIASMMTMDGISLLCRSGRKVRCFWLVQSLQWIQWQQLKNRHDRFSDLFIAIFLSLLLALRKTTRRVSKTKSTHTFILWFSSSLGRSSCWTSSSALSSTTLTNKGKRYVPAGTDGFLHDCSPKYISTPFANMYCLTKCERNRNIS